MTSSEGGATVSRHLIGSSPSPAHADDLIELLAQLGLEKYIDIFQQQEVNAQPTHIHVPDGTPTERPHAAIV